MAELQKRGWRVGVIWECEAGSADILAIRIIELLSGTKSE